jgi:hypothetical protein
MHFSPSIYNILLFFDIEFFTDQKEKYLVTFPECHQQTFWFICVFAQLLTFPRLKYVT